MSSVTAVPLRSVKRSYLVYLWVGIVLAVIAAAALAVVTPQIKLVTLKLGSGPHPGNDDVALVTYVGRLTNGMVFDQSQQPTPMPVAAVVPGFSQGLKQMAKGGKYRLTIPPALGYGAKAAGPIPANSTLVFDVTLIDFKSMEEVRRLQAQQQMMMQMMHPQSGGAQGMAPGGAGAPPSVP